MHLFQPSRFDQMSDLEEDQGCNTLICSVQLTHANSQQQCAILETCFHLPHICARVSEAVAKLRSAHRDAITAAGTPGTADAVAVRVNAEWCLAEVRNALLDAEAYEAEIQAALPIEPTPEPTGRLVMPNISQINFSAP